MVIGAAVAVVVMLAAFAVFSETEKPLNLVDTLHNLDFPKHLGLLTILWRLSD